MQPDPAAPPPPQHHRSPAQPLTEEQRRQQWQMQQVNSVTGAMVAAETCPTAALQAAADTDWAAHAAQNKQPPQWYGDSDTFRRFVDVVRVWAP